MPKVLNIRPHHFLCISGYKGYNYNSESADNWTRIISELKNNPEQMVKVTLYEDSLCKACKHAKDNCNTCDKNFVSMLDERVKKILELDIDSTYCYEKVINKLYSIMNPEKHEEICNGCGWRKKGLCKDTFEKIQVLKTN